MNIKGFFSRIFGLIATAFKRAQAFGLDNQLIEDTIQWVEEASKKFKDSAARREFVVGILVARKVPENIARLAVELAVQIWKARTGK